jgi:hypothetical protein
VVAVFAEDVIAADVAVEEVGAASTTRSASVFTKTRSRGRLHPPGVDDAL